PAGIRTALGQRSLLHPSGDLQVFERDRVGVAYQVERHLVVKVLALASHLLMLLSDRLTGLLLMPTALRATRPECVCLGQRLFGRTVVLGILDRLPSEVMSHTLSPIATPASCLLRGKGGSGTAAHEQPAYQPAASRLTGPVLIWPSIGRALRRAIRPPPLRQGQQAVLQTRTVALLLVGEGVQAILALEARAPWLCTCRRTAHALRG